MSETAALRIVMVVEAAATKRYLPELRVLPRIVRFFSHSLNSNPVTASP